MNAQAALQQFASNVASAPKDHWLETLCAEGQDLIREAREGRLPQEQVESEIARVANKFDVDGKVDAAAADAIWDLLRQAKGELAIPDRDEPEAAAEPEADIEMDENPLDESRAEIPRHALQALESWDRTLAGAESKLIPLVFTRGVAEVLTLAKPDSTPEVWLQLIDDLHAMGKRHGLSDAGVQGLMEAARGASADRRPGSVTAAEPPEPPPEDRPYFSEQYDPAPAPKRISATPFAVCDPATLPVRDVLYGRHLIRGYVSGFIGVPGGGKSAHSTAETLARVSGKPLLGIRVRQPLRCWNINLEDPRDEVDRRAQAGCLHYGLTADDIGDRLFLDSGRDQPVVVARTLAGGTQIVEPVVENIIAEIIARKIDVLTIDPFVSSHEVPENDNGAIDLVLKRAWGQVAERGRCAVELVHHLRKIGDDEPTVDAARGASAFSGALRAIRVLAVMTKAEAERADVENPYRYFRVFSGKLNMAPREDKSEWQFLESVDLGNGTADRPSDHVQVAVPWQWPNATDGLAVRDLFAVQKRISEGQWRESAQSPQWAGNAVAEVLDLDIEDAPPQARVKSLLKTWIASGALKVVVRPDEQRKERKFIEVGQWATD